MYSAAVLLQVPIVCRQHLNHQSWLHPLAGVCKQRKAPGLAAVSAFESAIAEESPAVQTTLATLGWPALCQFVALFASTTLGRQAVQQLPLPQEQLEVEVLVKETAAVDKLETEYAVELDFGGTSTLQV